MKRSNLVVLYLGTMLSISATSIMVLVGGIVGAELAPDPIWSTLPISLMTVGLALTTIPSAMVMKRVGRRLGFSVSAVVAICGALLAASVVQQNFTLFCLAALLMGTNSAYVQQYRFAAVESVEPRLAGRAARSPCSAGFWRSSWGRRSPGALKTQSPAHCTLGRLSAWLFFSRRACLGV